MRAGCGHWFYWFIHVPGGLVLRLCDVELTPAHVAVARATQTPGLNNWHRARTIGGRRGRESRS